MKNYSEFIKDLSSLISIRSVKGEKSRKAPFGEDVLKALNTFLDIAKKMGFDTINYNNYAGEVSFGGGDEIGIIGHLDVVPEGSGWDTAPYTLTLKNGTYYGRGVCDDKGPLLMCLYALKELKDSGITPKRKIRLFAGCNEESGWEDAKYLKKKGVLPETGFSPDGNFPISYSEKGMGIITFKLPKLKNFYGIQGGTVINAVCGTASVCAYSGGINESLLYKHKLMLKDGNRIVSVGKSCHGSSPENGINALNALFDYFSDMGENVNDFIDCVLKDKFNLSKMQTEQGFVTISPDLIKEDEDGIYISCDLRVPAPLTFNKVKKVIDKFNIPYSLYKKHPPFMTDKNGEFVNTLLSSYIQVTGDTSAKPNAMRGSTFARVFKKGNAFGVEFPNEDGHVHEPNERMKESTMQKAYEIYKTAIFNLATK